MPKEEAACHSSAVQLCALDAALPRCASQAERCGPAGFNAPMQLLFPISLAALKPVKALANCSIPPRAAAREEGLTKWQRSTPCKPTRWPWHSAGSVWMLRASCPRGSHAPLQAPPRCWRRPAARGRRGRWRQALLRWWRTQAPLPAGCCSAGREGAMTLSQMGSSWRRCASRCSQLWARGGG